MDNVSRQIHEEKRKDDYKEKSSFLRHRVKGMNCLSHNSTFVFFIFANAWGVVRACRIITMVETKEISLLSYRPMHV